MKRRLVHAGGARSAPGRSLVFSFGSNLHDVQLRERCPDAMRVGPAELRGFRLAFVGHSTLWGGAVATVRPAAKAVTPGELVLLTDADLTRLDGFEGAPHVYKRTQVKVATRSTGGAERVVTAWTYVRDGGEATPSLTYVARIACGYGRLGYHDAPIVRAIHAATKAAERRWAAFAAQVEPAREKVGGARRMSECFEEIDDYERGLPDDADVPPAWFANAGRAS